MKAEVELLLTSNNALPGDGLEQLQLDIIMGGPDVLDPAFPTPVRVHDLDRPSTRSGLHGPDVHHHATLRPGISAHVPTRPGKNPQVTAPGTPKPPDHGPSQVGSIDALDVADGSLAGVLGWYSVVHTPPGELGTVLGELIRVLAPGGWLLLAFQSGHGALHLTRAHGHDIDLTAHLHTADEVARLIEERGGTVHLRMTRGPDGAETLPQAFVLAHV